MQVTYLELQNYFILDTALLPNFVYTCPESELAHLFQVINPFYALARLQVLYGSLSANTVTDPLDRKKVCNFLHLHNTIIISAY